jgi:large subunit ribosomal protein L21
MYAIAEINGKQYKIEKDKIIDVERFDLPENSEIVIDTVLLVSDGTDVKVGHPYLANVKIKALLMEEVKDKKVLGVKFKKRKNYTRTIGHRHIYSRLKINELLVG